MQIEPPDRPENEDRLVGKIFLDSSRPGFVLVVTENRSWRVDGYILESILNNHMRGVNNSEVDAPNPFIEENSGMEEDWNRRRGKQSKEFI